MKEFKKILFNSLKNIYSKSEIQIFNNLILEKVTGLNRAKLLANNDIDLDENQEKLALEYLERLKNLEPIHYILGETEFYGLKLKVDPSVLIPRPETEELVEWVLFDINMLDNQAVRVLDIGTGSGAIAIAIKSKNPKIEVSGMDISTEALKNAEENVKLNNVEVDFIEDNILTPKSYNQKWDVIVSNPPYIPIDEKSIIDKQVVDFEPHVALFSPSEKPLLFFHKIAAFAISHLAPQGNIYFETHKDHARNVAKMLGNYGFTDVVIRNDISGHERMVRGSFMN
jgi:release factor glutamine methyltransferase